MTHQRDVDICENAETQLRLPAMNPTPQRLEMRRLAEVTELLPTLVAWFEREWEPYYGVDGPGDAELDLRASMNRDNLPICLIAFAESGEPLGTISLKAESISHPQLSPWGAAFVVSPSWRRRGVGGALVAFLEEEARRLGFGKLYMSTDGATSIVERRGWQAFDTMESLRGTLGVYSIDLRDA